MSLLERLQKAMHEAFAVAPQSVTRETVPDDIAKWDSIGHMNLVASLEKEFDLQFEVDEIMEMASVAKILEILAKRGIQDE